MDRAAGSVADFDQVALVVDWLDACRNRDLTSLLDLYAVDARLECHCGEVAVSEGRSELESYWQPRLASLTPTAFVLEEIVPTVDGVELDYLNDQGRPVHIAFIFTRDGKIQRTSCGAAAALIDVASQPA